MLPKNCTTSNFRLFNIIFLRHPFRWGFAASGDCLSGLSSDRLYIPPALLPSQKVEPLCDLALTHGGQGRFVRAVGGGLMSLVMLLYKWSNVRMIHYLLYETLILHEVTCLWLAV